MLHHTSLGNRAFLVLGLFSFNLLLCYSSSFYFLSVFKFSAPFVFVLALHFVFFCS